MSRFLFWMSICLGFHGAAEAAFLPSATPKPVHRSIVPSHYIVKTKNNVEIYVFPSAKVPIFDVELVYQGGALEDPPGKSGTANMLATLMARGAGGRSEKEALDLLDQLGGGANFSVDPDEFIASAYGLNSEYRAIIDYIFDGLERPKLDKDVLARVKKNLYESISRISESPESLAAYAADLIADNGTPYARPLAGGPGDLKSITMEDLENIRGRVLRPDRLKVLVIARKNHDRELKPILDYLKTKIEGLSCLSCGKPVEKPRTYRWPTLNLNPGSVAVVNRSGFTETYVYMVGRGPKRMIPEYYDLLLAEAILGGNFSSRLVNTLREKLNLTYSVNADFEFSRTSGAIKISTSTKNERLPLLLEVLNTELQEFAKDGVTDDEVARAKEYLLGSFPLGLQNSFMVAERYFRALLDGLPKTVLDDYTWRIGAATSKTVNSAIKKYFKPEEFITVISGDATLIHKQLKSSSKEVVDLQSKDVVNSY